MASSPIALERPSANNSFADTSAIDLMILNSPKQDEGQTQVTRTINLEDPARVLIIDDNIINIVALKAIFDSIGVQTEAASNGQDALNLV